jgi:hypothetical protein
VGGIVFLISFSAYSLLAFRKATDFLMLILYLATLPKVFIRAKRFLMESLESFKYRIVLSSNMDNWTSSFLFVFLFLALLLCLRIQMLF